MENTYLVIREKGNVIVSIMFSEFSESYHFVNITKSHICKCTFKTISDAIDDMKHKKDNGEIIDFIEIEI